MSKIEWRTDDDGDINLIIDGEYMGLVCPHQKTGALAVAEWGDIRIYGESIDQAKERLLKAMERNRKIAEFAAKLDEEGEGA